MTSLMSIFDPSISASVPFAGWSVILLVVMPLKLSFWNSSSSIFFLLKKMMSQLLKLFKYEQIVFVALFFFVLDMNLMGLLPLVFSPTSHLSFNLVLSLTLWLGMMIWYASSNLGQMLEHLTPQGSPVTLSPMLVLIELVSSLIRPMTLSLRLMANIMAGHMILTLLSKGVYSFGFIMGSPLMLVLTGFMMFEFGVALIQAYVFTSLMALYWEETSH